MGTVAIMTARLIMTPKRSRAEAPQQASHRAASGSKNPSDHACRMEVFLVSGHGYVQGRQKSDCLADADATNSKRGAA